MERLWEIERIINALESHDKTQNEKEERDRQSARDALEAARFPKDVLPADVLRHQTYKLMEKERDSMLEALSKVEADVEQLDERIKRSGGQADQGAQILQAVGQDLQKSADLLTKSADH